MCLAALDDPDHAIIHKRGRAKPARPAPMDARQRRQVRAAMEKVVHPYGCRCSPCRGISQEGKRELALHIQKDEPVIVPEWRETEYTPAELARRDQEDSRIRADQDKFKASIVGPIYEDSRPDNPLVVCRILTDPEDICRKRLAENDDHPLSRDWEGARRELEGFTYLCLAREYGDRVPVKSLDPGVWDYLSDTSRVRVRDPQDHRISYAVALAVEQNGGAEVLSDPVDLSSAPERFPACPCCPGLPKGKRLGRKTAEMILAYRAGEGNAQVSYEQCARHINCLKWRAAHGFEGYAALAYDNAERATERLIKSGQLRRQESPKHYRKAHRWRTIPARITIPGGDDE